MTRYSFRCLCVCALCAMPLVGCGETTGAGGSGGSAGTGGDGGSAGMGGSGVACDGNVCACTEAGIRAAIAEGGGPYMFDCQGPQTVVTEAEIIIDNDVVLDGEGDLTVDGNEDHRVFSVLEDVAVELRGFLVTGGRAGDETQGGSAPGGGIANNGTLTLTNSTVSGNNAGFGGGVSNYSTGGTLTLANSTVSGNSAGFGGGVGNNGTLTLTNSTVSGNNAVNYGGGIYHFDRTLTLTNSTVSGNSAGFGGGISNGFGTLTVTNSTVSNNAAAGAGGGISNIADATTLTLTSSTVSHNSAYVGGGISNTRGPVTLTSSTVSDNGAVLAGGGIHNEFGTLTLTNSTVSNNGAEVGGGISKLDGTVTFTNSTVSGNEADVGGGIYSYDAGTLTLTNTLVEGDCGGATDVSGRGNLESPGDTCGLDQSTDQVNVSAEDLALGPLADNGGPTMTHALLPGSVAIDVIPEAECLGADSEPLTVDQRGVARPQGDTCDVGAFELEVGP